MPNFACELEGLSVVLLGHFNPSIVQPSWLALHGLVAEQEAREAKIDIIRPEVSVFGVGLLRLIVDLDRFQVETTTAEAALQLRDLALGVFRLLEHTPISQMGINRHMHFRMPSEEAWHTVGHKLVPKEKWKDLVESPGTVSLTIQGKHPASPALYIRVTIEPSKRIQHGVYVGTNEHFQTPAGATSSELLNALSAEWEPAIRYSREIAEELLIRFLEDET